MFRTKPALYIGTTTELNALPGTKRLRPGTLYWNKTTKEMYILGTDGLWVSTNKYSASSGSESLYHYHQGS